MTISGALKYNFGVSVMGPAGTGKTETIRDFAKAIGIICIVFNCSESVDLKIYVRFFSGIC